MKISTKRSLSILTSVVLFIATLFVFSSFIEPSYQDILGKRSEVNSRLNLLNDYNISLAHVQQLASQYKNVAQFQQTISTILPTAPDVSQAVNQISSLANINRLAIGSISVELLPLRPPVDTTISNSIGTLRLNVRLTGDYQGFKSFLQNLETNINLMDLNSLKVDAFSSRPGAVTNQFTYTMSIDTYYQSN